MVHSNRYIPNTGPLARFHDPHQHLLESLTFITEATFPSNSTRISSSQIIERCGRFSGLYGGPTSIAYLFITLSRYYPSLEIRAISLKAWAKRFLSLASQKLLDEYKWTNSKCGIHNEALVHAVVHAIVNNDTTIVHQICSEDILNELLKEGPEDEGGGVDEWLYGRAGFLYLLRVLRSWFVDGERRPGNSEKSVQFIIDFTARKIIERILLTPRPWTIWGSPYIGAVHGASGIITQIVLTLPSYAPQLESELDQLLSLQLPSGNWPTQFGKGLRSSSGDKLVQFCHGAPGFVISLMTLRPYFPSLHSKIDNAIFRARECVWVRGLLTKDPNLCHGIAGNALVFSSDFTLTDRTTRDRFQHFMSFLKRENVAWAFGREIFIESEAPLGLYCGEAGRAWLWAVAEKNLDWRAPLAGKLIGYNDV